MRAEGGILAVLETGLTGEPTAASLETIGAAGILAQGLGLELCAAVGAKGPGRHTALNGVRSVYELRCESDASISAEAVWCALEASRPTAVFLPDSPDGRTAACIIAARLQAELVSGCTFLNVRDGKVQVGRPCLSGRAFAQFEWDRSAPIVVSVAQGAFSAPTAGNGPAPEITALDVRPAAVAPGVTVVSEVAPSPEAMGVNDADVLVAGGAGVGGSEGFVLLSELARKLGGTIAASRVAVDRGWIPSDRQVGLTGRSVAPQVYLAFGISGAPQHIAGIRSAGKVVAINKDARAPIFDVADLAVIADLHELVPALLERLPEASVNGKEG